MRKQLNKFLISILTVFMCLSSTPVYAQDDEHNHEGEEIHETSHEHGEEHIEEENNNQNEITEEGDFVVEEVSPTIEEIVYYCNKEEHTHGEECFDNYRVLICEEEHEHEDECFKEYSFMICEKEEHIHDENCLDENYEEPLIEVDEFVLEQRKQFEELLNKALNEEEGYFLNCEKVEHTHTPECFEYKEDLICEKEEILDEENENYHVHTDECYEKYYVIICEEKEEHTHTMDCISHHIETGEIEDVVIEVPSEVFDEEIDHSDIPSDETIEEETPIRQLMRAPRLLGSASGVNIREFVVQQFYGGKMQSGKYTWDANYNTSGHRFSFRLNYALGGVGELDANSVVFTIPKQILRDRSNNFAGTYEMSIPSKRDVDSGEELDTDISFAYYEDGNNIKIYNFKPISAGSNGYIELSYITNKTATNYKDMGKSDNFVARMDVTNNEQTISSTSGTYNVYINTTAKISSVVKGPNGYPSRYSSWQSSWGTAPANADNYYYLVWTIKTTVAEPVTQPYNFTLQDTLQTANGEVIGYKFSGQSTYSMNNTITNQTSDGYRYDYVLTRHPKSYWQPLEHWSIKNNVTAIVDPIDQVDADTKASASQTYVWNKPVFTIPYGHFNSYKRADGNWRACDLRRKNGSYDCILTYLTELGMKAGEYSRYDLDEFQDGTITELSNLDYAVWMRGYPYPWTYQANSSLGPKDPNNYGILKVKFELIDEGVYLYDEAAGVNENLQLDYNDFEIDTIAYSIRNNHVTGFNEETQSYITSSNIFDSNDILNFYGKFANGDWVKIATYKPLDKTTWFDSNYVESMTNSLITLKDNCVAYKVDTTNSHYYTEVNTVPNMHLKNSTKVMNFVQNKQSIGIYNKQIANFYKQDGAKILTTGEADSNFARVTQKDSYIFKDSVAATNNVKKKYYAISWKIGMTEQYIAGEGNIDYINQNSGVFYDLLPKGAVLDVNSVSVRAGTSSRYSNAVDTAEKMKNRVGQFLPSTAFTVEQIPDYKGTGRTLLIVRIKEEAKYYDVFFDTIHSWDSISDWGNDVYNPVAYETGNDKIRYGTNNDGGNIDEKDLMANLPSDAQGEKFIYAQSYFDIATITAASTGLTKKVKALDDKDFSYDTITTNDGNYEYRWRIASSHTSKTKNIILFDSMENYVVEGKASDWHGTIQSIDLSQPKSMGINPVLYYSTIENLDIENNHDITDSSVWQRLTDQTDLSIIKALAADLRKTTSGSDFILEEGQSLSIILHMRAPHGAESQGTYPEAYNNIYLQDTVIGLAGTPQDFFIHQDYTTVRFVITEDLTLKKVSSEDNTTPLKDLKFRLRGTSDYGTEEDRIIATDNTGTIVFKDIEKGSYVLSEYESTKDWLLNPAEFTVTVNAESVLSITGQENSNFLDFTYNNGIYTLTVKDDPRVHGDVTILKRREGDSADDIEVKQMLANANIGDTVTYNDKEYVVLEKTNSKVKLGESEREMTTKYAVQIYGIEQDTLEDGSTAGLTFGPALGQNFMNTYISHTPSENTASGNAHRCVHDDNWETIIHWNNVDPAVYEQCVANNCTHSVELSLSDTLRNPNFMYGGSDSGDGVGTLYYEFTDNTTTHPTQHVMWNPLQSSNSTQYGTNYGGWGASRIRAMLNGADSLTTIGDNYGTYLDNSIYYRMKPTVKATDYIGSDTLLSAFPQILQDNIGARKTLYDSVYNSKTATNLKTSYDKLWLLSPNEMADSISDEKYNHPLEAPNGKYQKFVENNLNLSTTSSNTAFIVYRCGNTGLSSYHYWWLRSSYSSFANNVLSVRRDGYMNSNYAYNNYGVSPCFSLSRTKSANSTTTIDGGLWVDFTIKPQTPISDTTFKLSGTSDYGTQTTKLETTNTAGRVTFTDIELGTYTLEEVIPNEDYILNNTKWTVKVDEQGNVSIIEPEDESLRDRLYTVEQVGNNYVIFNEPRYWNFTLRKIDKENETIWIQGAEFTLSGISDLGTEYNEVVESNENGRVIFNRIEKGTYILKETKAPTGVTETGAQGGNRNYIADPKEYIVKIDNQGNVTINGLNMNQYDDFVVKNDRAYDGKITIVKKWEDNLTNDERPEPVVHLSTNEPNWKRGITVTKVWEGDSAEDRPEDIKVYLSDETKYTAFLNVGIVKINDTVNRAFITFINQEDNELTFPSEAQLYINDYAITQDNYTDSNVVIPAFNYIDNILNKPNNYTELSNQDNKYYDTYGTVHNLYAKYKTSKSTIAATGDTLTAETYTLAFENPVIATSVSNGWTKNADNTWTYTFDILLEDENADKEFYVWEEDNVEGYKVINNSNNPIKVENQKATVTNEKVRTSGKYAVSIWGIEQDVDENGRTMGLTFGPAIGEDYTNSFKSHTPTGNTSSGNAHRCVHDDDWNTIIEWNNTDPYVYEQCIAENCTHSVELHEAGKTIVNPQFEASGTGDGASVLYRELVQYDGTTQVYENLRWHPNASTGSTNYGTNAEGWGASRIRAMMNGADSLTDVGTNKYASSASSDINKSASVYTSTNNLLATFPEELQAAIGKRKTVYDSVYNQKTAANLKTTYDKLWLLSPAEINYTGTTTNYQHPLEAGTVCVYQKITENAQSITNSTNNFYKGYYFSNDTATSGTTSYWWLRSSSGGGAYSVLLVFGSGGVGSYYASDRSGVSPCFSLKR